MRLFNKLIKLRDSIGKDAQLGAFSSFRLQLDAEDELTVCGCKSLCDVSDTYVCVACFDRMVELWGTGLQIVVFDDAELRFSGNVEKIGFSRLLKRQS